MSIGIILYGLNRAISTGSFDALFIDSYIDVFGKNKLHDITTRINVLDALGLAAGSLSGGILPEISNGWSPIFGTYDLNLVVQIVMTIILIILVIIFVNEANLQQKEERISVIEHVKRSSLFIVNSKNVICIFISVFATGYFLSALETYWQPHFISLQTNNDQLFLLGIVAFLYLVAAMAGSLISNKNIDRFNSRKIYLVLRVLMSISIVFTALQTNISSFIVCYIITYLIFGMANIPEAVILNREISNKIRASILSLNSLILQIGMLLGSIANSIMIKYISIPRIWIISAIIIFLSILITSKKLLEADKFSSS
ncbi:MFS transporter [Schnuerera sp. xch1]|uniref:MFS transporter n=1 Tax=Schnuerera sp. xch1 TaxID=2874283 RepID=UPI001CBC102A|nr:MFS transporter [Schnuerera sp. xch1]